MHLIECMMRQSTCYKGTTTGVPVGVLWHDTGAGNPNLKRYVQPDDNAADREALLQALGVNGNRNDWNHVSVQAGVNAFIGKLADGSVATAQVLPWDYRPWGCCSGRYGSCNGSPNVKNSPFWLQFEICDDGYKSKDYFDAVYREACELTAYLCARYGLDPMGAVSYNGVTVPTILCHADSYKLGLGSNHGDVLTWFGKFGKTMDDVRRDVAAIMQGGNMAYYKTFDALPDWAKPELKKIMDAGALRGDENGDINLSDEMLRGLIIGARYTDHAAQSLATGVESAAREAAKTEVKRIFDAAFANPEKCD